MVTTSKTTIIIIVMITIVMIMMMVMMMIITITITILNDDDDCPGQIALERQDLPCTHLSSSLSWHKLLLC